MQSRIRTILIGVAMLIASAGRLAAQDPSDPFFDDTVLHDISLTINSRDWASLKEHYLENTYYPADFRTLDQTIRNIGIRSRGTGSRSPIKPGLRVDFDRYVTGQKFLTLKSFILRNNTQDASGMRERLSMLVFRRMGVVAEREAHARLFVNGAYVGLFTIVESVDKDFLAKNFGETGEGYSYEYHFDNAAVAAGLKPFTFNNLGSDPALYVPTPFKPETHEEAPQADVVQRWIQTVADTGAAAWRSMQSQYLDLAKFVRHLAVTNFLADQDGITGDFGPNNFYVYRLTGTTQFVFIPWDKSNAFWDTNMSVFRNINDGPEDHRNGLAVRAFKEADLLKLYLDTLNETADSVAEGQTTAGAPGWLEQQVGSTYEQIHAAALSDTLIFSNADFEKAVTDLRAFARDRSAAVRAQVAAAAPK